MEYDAFYCGMILNASLYINHKSITWVPQVSPPVSCYVRYHCVHPLSLLFCGFTVETGVAITEHSLRAFTVCAGTVLPLPQM
jgi:hypothetical protein